MQDPITEYDYPYQLRPTTKFTNSNLPTVLLCNESYSFLPYFILGHLIYFLFLAFKVYIFYIFQKVKHLFPLKQRAPNLALI